MSDQNSAKNSKTKSEIVLGYIPCANQAEATTIAKKLLNENLIACANLYNGMTSIYRWQSEIQTDSETLLLIKTNDSLIKQIEEKISSWHSYEVPAILFFTAASVNQAYHQWLDGELIATPPVNPS